MTQTKLPPENPGRFRQHVEKGFEMTGGVGRNIAVGFAGPIASGKSTLLTALQVRSNGTVASYGDLIRSALREKGLEISRSGLQSMSDVILSEYTHAELAGKLLLTVGWRGEGLLLIDGIRHRDALSALRELLMPAPVWLVFVKTPDIVRRKRIEERDGISAEKSKGFDAHETESEAHNELESIADLVVDGSNIDEAVDFVVKTIGW